MPVVTIASMPSALPDFDAVVIGGGIAGLMTLDALIRRGCRACLVERTALGHGQTVWSQGIIHGGLKYALGGRMGTAARAIRDMPHHWTQMLSGERLPCLSNVTRRADACALWAARDRHALAGLLGARLALRASPTPWPDDSRPDALRQVRGRILRVPEPVLEPTSLLGTLRDQLTPHLLRGEVTSIDDLAGIPVLTIQADERTWTARTTRVLITAGLGASELCGAIGVPDPPAMQKRPLRMVLARGPLPVLNGHCIRGTKPWLTITTVANHAGPTIWQIGGDVAEAGANQTEHETLVQARGQLATALPGIDFKGVSWSTYMAPRAELETGDGGRPDRPGIIHRGPCSIAWPTKLALAPMLASDLSSLVTPTDATGAVPLDWPRPPVATPPWEETRSWTTDHSATPA